jgi:hypothetical protein
MRVALMILGAVTVAGIGSIAGASRSEAQTYPWCATYARGETNCGFSTHAQCEAARSGNGGYCYENPMFFGTGERPRARYYNYYPPY